MTRTGLDKRFASSTWGQTHRATKTALIAYLLGSMNAALRDEKLHKLTRSELCELVIGSI